MRISALETLFHAGRVPMEDNLEAISTDRRAREICLGHRA